MASIAQLRPIDPNLSTVAEELDALDRELARIARELTNILEWNESGREHAITCARRALDTAAQRSYRAKQISRGLKVNKPT